MAYTLKAYRMTCRQKQASDAEAKKVLSKISEDLGQMDFEDLEAPIFADGATWESYQKAAMDGSIPDEDNPAFIFNMIPSHLLRAIVRGDINANALAKKELEIRR